MKRLYPTVVLTGLLTLALGLSACSSLRGETGSLASGSSGASGSSESSSAMHGLDKEAINGSASVGTGMNNDSGEYATGAQGASGALGASGSSALGQQDASSPRSGLPASASSTPNGTVVSIEPLASNGSTGSSSRGSATGSVAGAEQQAYRVTLRMDDGSTQVVSQGTPPGYRPGDRINLSGGIISRSQ